MSKKAFDRIAAGLNDVAAYLNETADLATFRVHVAPEMDVKAIRRKTGLSQNKFAARFGVPPGTLRDWEQGRSKPDTTARAYLKVIEKDPEAVEKALGAA